MVDFRVDEDKIKPGECVVFSWVVRGDIDTVEFDQIGDGKVPILVPDMDSRDECPEKETKYELGVNWLDGTQTTRTIEIEVEEDGGSGGGSGTGSGTPTPGGTAVFVPVTPIPIVTTPVSVGPGTSVPLSSGGAVVTPVGVLSGVQVLPETGHNMSSSLEETEAAYADSPNRAPGWILAGGLAAFWAALVIGWAIRMRSLRTSEVPR